MRARFIPVVAVTTAQNAQGATRATTNAAGTVNTGTCEIKIV